MTPFDLLIFFVALCLTLFLGGLVADWFDAAHRDARRRNRR